MTSFQLGSRFRYFAGKRVSFSVTQLKFDGSRIKKAYDLMQNKIIYLYMAMSDTGYGEGVGLPSTSVSYLIRHSTRSFSGLEFAPAHT